jgi:hypothetical protein
MPSMANKGVAICMKLAFAWGSPIYQPNKVVMLLTINDDIVYALCSFTVSFSESFHSTF